MDSILWTCIGLAVIIIVLPFIAHAFIYFFWYRNWKCPRCGAKTIESESENGETYRICPDCGDKWLINVENNELKDEKNR